MGGFGGSASAMIRAIKYNKAILGKRKTAFEQLKEHQDAPKRKLDIKKASSAETYAFLDFWKEKQASKRKRKPFIVICSIIISILVTGGIIKLIELVFL